MKYQIFRAYFIQLVEYFGFLYVMHFHAVASLLKIYKFNHLQSYRVCVG